jgi:indolepyruvate ferredoxin oxidoreductase, beta subunit
VSIVEQNASADATPVAAPSDVPEAPVSILIAALGGEGGGLLTDWVVTAAEREDFIVQSTSIPGLAQRTGATTYFVEIFPASAADLNGRMPVLTLLPNPGDIDIMVASELLEAGRAVQNGFITPDKTTLIASTHRVYATIEKAAMGDGRADTRRVIAAAQEMAREAVLFDMGKVALESGSVINSVLLGAMAGSGRLPMKRETLEGVIRDGGIAVENNLQGFAAGFDLSSAKTSDNLPSEPKTNFKPSVLSPGALAERVDREYPGPALAMVNEAVARLIEYQDAKYAGLFLDRLDPIREHDVEHDGENTGFEVTIEAARAMAHWMAYEDVIRVADLKTRPERLQRIRNELKASDDQPVVVIDFLKPGLEEFCSIMPGFIARPLLGWAARNRKLDSFNVGLHITTSGVLGYSLMRFMARLKGIRRAGHRYATEQALIERWLASVKAGLALDRKTGLEIISCARLVKGYGETHRRGSGNLTRILGELVEPALAEGSSSSATQIIQARDAALADSSCAELDSTMAGFLTKLPDTI